MWVEIRAQGVQAGRPEWRSGREMMVLAVVAAVMVVVLMRLMRLMRLMLMVLMVVDGDDVRPNTITRSTLSGVKITQR